MTLTTVIAFTSIGFLSLAATMPAGAQTAASEGGPGDRGAQDRAAIPDLSGIWGHLALFVEPPLSGPGPVRNLSRMTIEAARAVAPSQVGAANAGASPNGVSSAFEFVGDFANPILKPGAAAVVKQRGELE